MSERVIKERPILFSGPMIRAIMDGRKTQTRRVVKPQPPRGLYNWNDSGMWFTCEEKGHSHGPIHCPYGQPGDRLWVRETVAFWYLNGKKDRVLGYRADIDPEIWDGFGCDDPWWLYCTWTPSIHMPRWASRLTLQIEDVSVERVREITGDDALAEGVEVPPVEVFLRDRYTESSAEAERRNIAYQRFTELWDQINASRGYSWDSNPWVWAVTFKPID